MIDHAHFRMMSMADPYHRELSTRERDALQAHGAGCPACKQYHARLLQFEERLELAFRVQISHRAAPLTEGKRTYRFAASILVRPRPLGSGSGAHRVVNR